MQIDLDECKNKKKILIYLVEKCRKKKKNDRFIRQHISYKLFVQMHSKLIWEKLT